jgi:DNA-binding transcriptional regulator YiaG
MYASDIVAVRKTLGLTQKDLAAKLDVPTQLVAQWEKGERYTTKKHHEMLLRLAAAPPDPPATAPDPAPAAPVAPTPAKT